MIGEKFEKNNSNVPPDVFYEKKKKKKEIWPADISKFNSSWEKQVKVLMIPNDKRLTLSCSKKIACITKRNNFKK